MNKLFFNWIFVCALYAGCGLPGKLSAGILWPQGQAFPHFAAPADVLDGISVVGQGITDTEATMLAALQGLVNKSVPRIFLYDTEREPKNTWPDRHGFTVDEMDQRQKYELVAKYAGEIKGLVVYSTAGSEHYKNLASTIAGLEGALPVTAAEVTGLEMAGVVLPVIEDVSSLPHTTAPEIYTHLYENYWSRCEKRMLLSQRPGHGFIRDIGVATGSAILWLDPRIPDEEAVLRRFLSDMVAGESIILGWWSEERAGIGIGTQYGISTVPADFYENATVYAGGPHGIDVARMPPAPALENKVYIALFLSDGDNIQYCQHAMSNLWGHPGRGSIPINWTVSPALADLGPGLLNYYYGTATDNDCLVSGPSGLGYALIYDEHNDLWNTSSRDDFDPYAKLSGRYFEKSGLRVVTIWDNVNSAQMESYAENCPYLLGATRQDWGMSGGRLETEIAAGRLAFIPAWPCYTGEIEVIYRMWEEDIRNFDGSGPLFLVGQGESWYLGPDNLTKLKGMFEELSPGNVEFCRADHFFILFNEYMGLQ